MSQVRFEHHHRSEAMVTATPEVLFTHLDDHARLVRHMEKPSLMTAGGVFRVETDQLQGKAVGSVIRMSGAVLGIDVWVEEVVTEYRPPFSKSWETRREPRLLVVGRYQMRFAISPQGASSLLTVVIDYRLPSRGVARLFGRLLGKSYASWCTRRMVNDALSAFKYAGASS